MRYNGNNLKEVLEAHKRFLNNEPDRITEEEASIANFSYTNLRLVDLSDAVLSQADFTGADMCGAILTGADLSYATLNFAVLMDTTLTRANLRFADLCNAYLQEAVLTRTNLSYANLCSADLRGADLDSAILDNAILTNADLRNTNNCPRTPMACPSEGSFIAWKKCLIDTEDKAIEVIVKLKIPADAERSSATSSKCRASKAEVLEIQALDGEKLPNVTAYSQHDWSFIYEPGKIVTPKEPFCKDRYDLCASGIHFFIDRQEAVDYN